MRMQNQRTQEFMMGSFESSFELKTLLSSKIKSQKFTGLRLETVLASHECLDSGHTFVDESFLVEIVGATDRRRR